MSTYSHQPVDAAETQRQLGAMSLNQTYSSPRKDYRGGAEIIDFGPRSTSTNLKMTKSPSSVLEKFTIQRETVDRGKKKTWANTTTVPIPISQRELKKEVDEQIKKGVPVGKRLEKLANKARFQYDAVINTIEDAKQRESDPFAKCILVMIKLDRIKGGLGQPTVTTAIHIILERTIDDQEDARKKSSNLPFQASHGSSRLAGPVGGHGSPNGHGSVGGSQRMPPSGPGMSMYGQPGSGGIHPREFLDSAHERGMNQPSPHHLGASNSAQASYPPRDPSGGLRAHPNGDPSAKPLYAAGQHHQHPPLPHPGGSSHPALAQTYLARGGPGGFGGAMGGPQDPRGYPAGAGDDPSAPIRVGTAGGGGGSSWAGMRADARPPPPPPGAFGQPPPPPPTYPNRDPVGLSMGPMGGPQGSRGYPGGGDPSAPIRVGTVGGNVSSAGSTARPSGQFTGSIPGLPTSDPRQSDRPGHGHSHVPGRRPSTSSSNTRRGPRAMPEFVETVTESDDDDSYRDTDEDSQRTNPTAYSNGTPPRPPRFPKSSVKGSVKGDKPEHGRRPGEQSSRHAFDRRLSTSSSYRPHRSSLNQEQLQEAVEAVLMGGRPRRNSVHQDRPSFARKASRAGEGRSTVRRPPADRLDTTSTPSRPRRGGRSERADRDTLAQIASDRARRAYARVAADFEDDDDYSDDEVDEDDEFSYDEEYEATRYQAKPRRHHHPKEPRRREEHSTLRNDGPRSRLRRASTEPYHGLAPSSSRRRR